MEKVKKSIFICLIMFLSINIFANGQNEILKDLDLNEDNWSGWRGENHDGISSETGFNPKFLLNEEIELWSVKLGDGYSAPSIQGNLLYTMGNIDRTDIVYCLNAFTGEEVWRFEYNCSSGDYNGPRTTPLVDNGKVYTLSRKGNLYCFDALSGDVIWSKDLIKEFGVKPPKWDIAGSPIVDGDTLLINAGLSGLAFNKESGDLIWKGKPGTGGYSSPVVFTHHTGDRVMAIMSSKKLLIVKISDGEIIMDFPWRTSYDVNAADPIVFDNKVFISSGYRHGCSLLDISGSEAVEIWKNKSLGSHFSSFILKDGYLYGVNGNTDNRKAGLISLNFETGDVAWTAQNKFSSFFMVEDKLVVLGQRGDMYVAEANHKSFNEISRAKVGKGLYWTAPVMAHSLIYIRSDRGQLTCLRTK